jgi:hypothetical protein
VLISHFFLFFFFLFSISAFLGEVDRGGEGGSELKEHGKGTRLTRKHGKDAFNGRDIDPAVVVFLHAGRALVPVGVFLALVRGADKEPANLVLGSDHQQAVIGVRSYSAAVFAFSVGFISGGKPVVSVAVSLGFLFFKKRKRKRKKNEIRDFCVLKGCLP